MNYPFDRTPRWWKEMPRLDEDIKTWNGKKFLLMKELMELADRFGSPFDFGFQELADHLKTSRQTISTQMKALEQDNLISIKRGTWTSVVSTITLEWENINKIYLKHEASLKDMHKTSKSVKPFDAVKGVMGMKSVKQFDAVGRKSVKFNDRERKVYDKRASSSFTSNRDINRENRVNDNSSNPPTEGTSLLEDNKGTADFHEAVQDLIKNKLN